MSAKPRVTLIDNYDSFTWNLVHYLGELGADMTVWRNDKISAEAVLAARPDAIVLSPGPCTPNEAGICLDLIAKADGKVPLLGVCLGHQSIGQAYGGMSSVRRCRSTESSRRSRTGPRACFAASTGRFRQRATIRSS